MRAAALAVMAFSGCASPGQSEFLPGTETVFGLDACAGTDVYVYEIIAWSDEVAAIGRSAQEVIAERPARSARLSPLSPAGLADSPWLFDVTDWEFRIAPHPMRPPVKVSSAEPELCPEMTVLPVVGSASGGGGRIRVRGAGMSELPEWAADDNGLDLPWLYRNAIRVYHLDGAIATTLRLGPDDLIERVWPSAVDDAMVSVLNLDHPGFVMLGGAGEPSLIVEYQDGGAVSSVTLSARAPVGEEDAYIEGYLAQGFVWEGP